MKEFVEKLIGRLEEESELLLGGFGRVHYPARAIQVHKVKEIVNQLAEEYKSRIMIDGQYCFQTCACTEKCNECNRLTLTSSDIDWYENIEDWTEEYRPRTNADFIRKMNDEELAELFMKLAWNGEVQTTPLRYLDWLQSEVKGSE